MANCVLSYVTRESLAVLSGYDLLYRTSTGIFSHSENGGDYVYFLVWGCELCPCCKRVQIVLDHFASYAI